MHSVSVMPRPAKLTMLALPKSACVSAYILTLAYSQLHMHVPYEAKVKLISFV